MSETEFHIHTKLQAKLYKCTDYMTKNDGVFIMKTTLLLHDTAK
jgi:hypothetical protein